MKRLVLFAWLAAATAEATVVFAPAPDEDRADALQALIDANPNQTISIPDGVYLLSHPVATPAAPRLAVSLALADFAVLKAAPDFPAHQPMVRLGGDLPDANWWTGEAFVLPGYGHAERIYVPWRSMGHASTPARVGFTISLQDDDNGGERDHTLYWQGNPAKPHLDERAFGVLEFVRDRD